MAWAGPPHRGSRVVPGLRVGEYESLRAAAAATRQLIIIDDKRLKRQEKREIATEKPEAVDPAWKTRSTAS
jgi:hypothetical protein